MLDENLKPWVLEVNISPRYIILEILAELKLLRIYSCQATLRFSCNFTFKLLIIRYSDVRSEVILLGYIIFWNNQSV